MNPSHTSCQTSRDDTALGVKNTDDPVRRQVSAADQDHLLQEALKEIGRPNQ